MKPAGARARMHAQSLKYQLQARAIESWGTTLRYCLIIVVRTVVPSVTAWLLTRARL
jgi:hypothetical protein